MIMIIKYFIIIIIITYNLSHVVKLSGHIRNNSCSCRAVFLPLAKPKNLQHLFNDA